MADARDDASSHAGREGPADVPGASEQDRAGERSRRYRRAHPDRHAASTRHWKDAHPERVRELNRRWKAENLERSRELNRESARRTAARKRRLQEKRRRANEASRRWKEAHPERVRAYHREWTAANRGKVNEYYRRYHAKHREELNARATAWRDSQPDKMKRARKAWADRNKERTAEIQRKRRSDPEKYKADLETNAAARRLRVRLERAGLPPKQLRRSTAAERRTNDRAAEDYFADPRLPERLRQFALLNERLAPQVIKHGPQMRAFANAFVAQRARMGLPPVDAEELMFARAVKIVMDRMPTTKSLTSRDVAAAVRSAKATAAAAERKRELNKLVEAVQQHIQRHGARLHDDAELENLLRARRGKAKLPRAQLALRIALQEVAEARNLRLDPLTVRRVVELLHVGLEPIPSGAPNRQRPRAVAAFAHDLAR